ncbi:response regulator transcription factor [Mobilicoccus pelagius]|uniref:Putative two-component response regulator n=1 Tax=Mobilicoccus pelagius NBRC 104925 TaxID=1089455 RepID=H5UQR7_9MICO|nr:response regulator transcription factor [Mobilicoccus pelagius]GAB48075.1 putative two-component response regulator [Mobilicoccus pelagius NBRC 104925]
MTDDAPLVLVVDDEPQMLTVVGMALRAKGFRTITAATATAAWRVLTEHAVDAVVLDVMLPGERGVDLCRRVREVTDVPVLLLTALGTEEDRVAGLEVGADDYVVKPFSPRELALRVAALTRRRRRTAGPITPGATRSVGNLHLEAGLQAVTRDGVAVHTTPSEFRLLWLLAGHVGETVGHRALHEAIGPAGAHAGDRDIVRTAMYRLRSTLGTAPGTPQILTDRGRGYRLVPGT